jgi:hypothetical protein
VIKIELELEEVKSGFYKALIFDPDGGCVVSGSVDDISEVIEVVLRDCLCQRNPQ